jgi:hypothetical protein
MAECRLSRWADRAFFGWAFDVVYAPAKFASGRHWIVRLITLPIAFAWFAVLVPILIVPLSLLGISGAVWDMVSEPF